MAGLALNLKCGRSVYVADTKITICRVKGGYTKLLFEGPDKVIREELLKKPKKHQTAKTKE
jgi:sRNA-binding carbon storage regulator CsrA